VTFLLLLQALQVFLGLLNLSDKSIMQWFAWHDCITVLGCHLQVLQEFWQANYISRL
jgi:hypothetical protein